MHFGMAARGFCAISMVSKGSEYVKGMKVFHEIGPGDSRWFKGFKRF